MRRWMLGAGTIGFLLAYVPHAGLGQPKHDADQALKEPVRWSEERLRTLAANARDEVHFPLQAETVRCEEIRRDNEDIVKRNVVDRLHVPVVQNGVLARLEPWRPAEGSTAYEELRSFIDDIVAPGGIFCDVTWRMQLGVEDSRVVTSGVVQPRSGAIFEPVLYFTPIEPDIEESFPSTQPGSWQETIEHSVKVRNALRMVCIDADLQMWIITEDGLNITADLDQVSFHTGCVFGWSAAATKSTTTFEKQADAGQCKQTEVAIIWAYGGITLRVQGAVPQGFSGEVGVEGFPGFSGQEQRAFVICADGEKFANGKRIELSRGGGQ